MNAKDVNRRVEHRAAVVEEDDCRSCPCFLSYMDGSPGQRRGFIGACTAYRAEEPSNFVELYWTGKIPCERTRTNAN